MRFLIDVICCRINFRLLKLNLNDGIEEYFEQFDKFVKSFKGELFSADTGCTTKWKFQCEFRGNVSGIVVILDMRSRAYSVPWA